MSRMKVNPGELNKRIQIFREVSQGEDEEGYPLGISEETVRKCYAKFHRTSGTTAISAGISFSKINCRFLVRHSMKIEVIPGMKIRYSGGVYQIQYVNDYEDSHEYDEIWCERIV